MRSRAQASSKSSSRLAKQNRNRFSPRPARKNAEPATEATPVTASKWRAFSAALLPGPLPIHIAGATHTLDVDTLTYALGLVLIGAHITVFAVSAKVFGTQEGFLPPNPQFERLFKIVTLETGLLFGCFLLLAGAGILGYALYLWHAAGFGQLSPTRMLRLTLPSATLFMLGVEVIFGSFFLSLLGRNRR